jgi:DNA internalization-related competence protein ComEC/Rec2
LALIVCLAALLYPLPGTPILEVAFLDVGQGDSIVVRSPAGHVVVIDTGRAMEEDDMGRRTVVPYLRSKGISKVDLLVLTHPDDDHIGGASTLLRRLSVSRLATSMPATKAPGLDPVRQLAKERGTEQVTLSKGMQIDLKDGVQFDVLSPPATGVATTEHVDNNNSVVLRVHFGRTSFLLTGDAEAGAEQEMLAAKNDVHVDVLKLGHHGSKTSTTEPLLEATHPTVAVVSAGKDNRYGHPHPDVVKRLEARGIRIVRTDRQGTLTFTSDGNTIRMSATRH